ncbi:mechanosensitive ion channel family protein [Phormidium sp. CCY1219]|uniref:mechanosensitive ion channel family protein n=1 Tax=Phormidium sp. CCY1219 TaxID=2886104 RepID=UPI002D1E9275|nr:mechanosensitive ion channel family protein [Phormidium sp. CCY1219]MEB3826309.1 mechanosensitive ion channel family protein [Phormidium sp. CCY1219]
MFFPIAILKIFIPLGLILCGLIGGLIFEKRLFTKLKAIPQIHKLRRYKNLVESLKGMPFVIFFTAGIYGAIVTSGLTPTIETVLSKIILAFLLGAITLVFSRLSLGFIRVYSQTSERVLPLTSLLENLTRLFIFTLGTLIILQSIGISITPLLTALGVGGISIGLALQTTLANLFSGLNIIMSRKVNPGDYVKLETGEEGYVTDVTWRHTTIREIPNNLVVVPNSQLVSATFKNYALPQKEMMVLIEVGISYKSDLEKVEQVTLEVAKAVMREVPGGVPEFEPFVRYHSFGYFSINFTVYLAGQEYFDRLITTHEFIKRLHKRYQAEGIKIPFPIRPVYPQDGEKIDSQ